MKRIILDNVDELSRLSSYCLTGGRLNAYNALSDSAIHRTHTMVLDNTYSNLENHRYSCTGCLHLDYDAHTWTEVYYGTNNLLPPDLSINAIVRYECTVCGYNTPIPPSNTVTH